MTQLECGRKGVITPEMRRVAERENVTAAFIRDKVAAGHLVIPANKRHLAGSGGRDAEPAAKSAAVRLDPIGIGRSITTKINANIGASPVTSSTAEEVEKLHWAVRWGTDTLMDLSTGGNLDECRQAIIDNAAIPIGTVPIYSMIVGRQIEDLTCDDILAEIEKQAQQGVDFFTIHAGVLREHLPLVKGRIAGIVSRGGSLLAKWIIHHGRQNPMYEIFDEISAIMREYDVTYSLGDGLRPGSLADASDEAQFAELDTLGELVHRARQAGVQCMIEGPGHIPMDQIRMNVERQRRVCDDAPFYVLGPLVTDVFPGYDHITSCIGATEAGRWGAAMLCYVTPREHVGLPKAEDVKQGCIAYKIAAHAADIARGIPSARDWDDDMSRARAALNWPKMFELAFDGDTARALHDEDLDTDGDYCSMCGHDWCSMRISKEIAQFDSGKEADFQPAGPPAADPQSPGLANEPACGGPAEHRIKEACHSDNVADPEEARGVQKKHLQAKTDG